MSKIGLQLYSIKELTQEDFLGTLEKVAKIGYDGVEFAGFFNTPAGELAKVLKDLNLEPAGSHTGLNMLQGDNLKSTIEYNLAINNRYIVCPGLPKSAWESAEAWKRTAELFNEIGRQCKDNGIQFGYHNHDFEFQKFDGEYGLDILVANTDPDLVHIELDTFWVEYTGLRSVDFMKKYGKRCSLLHLKDMKSWDEKVNTEIGKGVMDFKEIVALAKELGTVWYTVEQEEFEIPQLQSIEESLKYVRSIL